METEQGNERFTVVNAYRKRKQNAVALAWLELLDVRKTWRLRSLDTCVLLSIEEIDLPGELGQ